MNSFKLTVVTPDGEKFSSDAVSILLRGSEGDVQILANHADYFTALGCGRTKITLPDGTVRIAAASGGFVSVCGGQVNVIATTFEYAEEIDIARARAAKERAEAIIASAKLDKETDVAKAKLRRALLRISVADGK